VAAFNKFHVFTENLAKGAHIFGTHQLTVALTPAANAPVVGNTILGNLTQISYTNLSARNVTTTSATQSPAGVFKLVCADLVLTAGPSSAPPFRYVVLYNDTQSTPVKPLIGWYDYGLDVTLNNGETFTIDFDGTNGVLTIT
jgi:hypothetical protein